MTAITDDPRDWPGHDRDRFGNLLAKVHVEDLEEWSFLLARLEDWLLHASEETIEDYRFYAGPCGPSLDDIVYMLGHTATYMRALAQGAPR